MNKGFIRRFKPLEIVTESQLEQVHQATLDVLMQTGVSILHERALQLMKDNDCPRSWRSVCGVRRRASA